MKPKQYWINPTLMRTALYFQPHLLAFDSDIKNEALVKTIEYTAYENLVNVIEESIYLLDINLEYNRGTVSQILRNALFLTTNEK